MQLSICMVEKVYWSLFYCRYVWSWINPLVNIFLPALVFASFLSQAAISSPPPTTLLWTLLPSVPFLGISPLLLMMKIKVRGGSTKLFQTCYKRSRDYLHIHPQKSLSHPLANSLYLSHTFDLVLFWHIWSMYFQCHVMRKRKFFIVLKLKLSIQSNTHDM